MALFLEHPLYMKKKINCKRINLDAIRLWIRIE